MFIPHYFNQNYLRYLQTISFINRESISKSKAGPKQKLNSLIKSKRFLVKYVTTS